MDQLEVLLVAYIDCLSLQFDLGPELIGVLFLVMSAFYAISSPIWGWVADRCVNVIFDSIKTLISVHMCVIG